MNTNSVEYKFGYIMGFYRKNEDMDFYDFINRINDELTINKITLTLEMLEMLMELYCSDIYSHNNIVSVGDDGIIGKVYYCEKTKKIIIIYDEEKEVTGICYECGIEGKYIKETNNDDEWLCINCNSI